MEIKNNTFKNNYAVYGGAGIYFNNKLPLKPIQDENLFIDNKAEFANDFYTFPCRLRLKQNNNDFFKTSTNLLKIIPGYTIFNLDFEIVDYFNQTIESLNGRSNLFRFSFILSLNILVTL